MQHVRTLTRTIPHTRTHKYSPQFFTQGNTNMPQILSLANTRTRTILHTRLQHNSSHTRKHTNTHNSSHTRKHTDTHNFSHTKTRIHHEYITQPHRHAQFLTHTQTYRYTVIPHAKTHEHATVPHKRKHTNMPQFLAHASTPSHAIHHARRHT